MADLMFQIPEPLAERLDEMATERGIPLEELVREVLIEIARRPAPSEDEA